MGLSFGGYSGYGGYTTQRIVLANGSYPIEEYWELCRKYACEARPFESGIIEHMEYLLGLENLKVMKYE